MRVLQWFTANFTTANTTLAHHKSPSPLVLSHLRTDTKTLFGEDSFDLGYEERMGWRCCCARVAGDHFFLSRELCPQTLDLVANNQFQLVLPCLLKVSIFNKEMKHCLEWVPSVALFEFDCERSILSDTSKDPRLHCARSRLQIPF